MTIFSAGPQGLESELIAPETTALIVIDLLRDYLEPGAPREVAYGREILPRVADLVDEARSMGVAVVYAVHAHAPDGSDMGRMARVAPGLADADGRPTALIRGTRGTEVAPPLSVEPGDEVVFKTRHSAFFSTDLHEILVRRGIETVVVCGLATNYCCDGTARDALYRDYRVVVLGDCLATFDAPDRGWGDLPMETVHAVTLSTISLGIGEVMSAEKLLDRLAQQRGLK